MVSLIKGRVSRRVSREGMIMEAQQKQTGPTQFRSDFTHNAVTHTLFPKGKQGCLALLSHFIVEMKAMRGYNKIELQNADRSKLTDAKPVFNLSSWPYTPIPWCG